MNSSIEYMVTSEFIFSLKKCLGRQEIGHYWPRKHHSHLFTFPSSRGSWYHKWLKEIHLPSTLCTYYWGSTRLIYILQLFEWNELWCCLDHLYQLSKCCFYIVIHFSTFFPILFFRKLNISYYCNFFPWHEITQRNAVNVI